MTNQAPPDPAVAKRNNLLAGILLAVLVAGLLLASGLHIPFPDFHEAENAWRIVIGGLVGLVILAAGVTIAYLAARKRSIIGLLLGVIVLFLALPLVNVAVGLPAPVKPFFDLLEFIVNFLNTILHLVGASPMRPYSHLGPEAEQLALLVEEARRFRRAYITLWTTLTLCFFLLLWTLGRVQA